MFLAIENGSKPFRLHNPYQSTCKKGIINVKEGITIVFAGS